MKKSGSSSKTDPIEQEIERALRPGSVIRDGECFSFVSGLDEVATTIDKLVASEAIVVPANSDLAAGKALGHSLPISPAPAASGLARR